MQRLAATGLDWSLITVVTLLVILATGVLEHAEDLHEHPAVDGQCGALWNAGLPDIEWLVVVDPRPDRGQSCDESHDRGSPNGQSS